MLNATLMDKTAQTATVTGSTLKVAGLTDASAIFACLVAANVAGTTPTLDVILEASWDNSNWVASGLAFTQVTTSTGSTEVKQFDPASHKLGPYMRAKATIGGTEPSYTFKVYFSAPGNPGYWSV